MRSDLDRNDVLPHKGGRGQLAGTTTVIEADSRRAWARQVTEGFAQMLADERAFILSSYADGQTQSSIATRAGVSDAAVSRNIASGMRKLAAGLEIAYRAER
jgi:DNA-directed RNA polymerase specialized sigma24 family protein